jgi:hypothetical protein
MASIRVEPDSGPPEEILPGGSRLTDGERAGDLLQVTIRRLRALNKVSPAREISLAIQRAEESLHWLQEAERNRRTR